MIKQNSLPKSLWVVSLLCGLTLSLISPNSGAALLDNIRANTGGHIKLRGQTSWPADDAPFQLVEGGPYFDGSIEGRLKEKVYFSENALLEVHYETILSGGDTRKKSYDLVSLYPGLGLEDFVNAGIPEDDHRVFDLTAVISDEENRILYHRLDRFSLSLYPASGVLRMGRQVATWGNGMLFNPMDLFNPFAPTDVEREYKIGDDMVSFQTPVLNSGDLQLLYVPRRDLETADISWDQSSVAGKYHFLWNMLDLSVMAAVHYEDYVLGVGSVGYIGNAAWRTDVTWTRLDSEKPSDSYFSLVANLDYSWVWSDKNFYGFLEFYYNGLGENGYENAYQNPDIVERIQRGELFTLGRTYLCGSLTVELHPLFNVHLTAITNMKDPSGFLQPMATYDISQDVRILMGANTPWGAKGSEFGGIEIPGTDYTARTSDVVYIWVSYYF